LLSFLSGRKSATICVVRCLRAGSSLREPLPDNQRNDDRYDAGVNQDPAKHRTVTVECARSLETRINIERGGVARGRRICVVGLVAFEVTS
jgi:hypothetical protein